VLLVIDGLKQIAQGGLTAWSLAAIAGGAAIAVIFVERQRRMADPLKVAVAERHQSTIHRIRGRDPVARCRRGAHGGASGARGLHRRGPAPVQDD
jgi:hypothetical protein